MIYENQKTKMTVEHYGIKFSIEMEHSDISSIEALEMLASLMYSMSFSQQQIIEAMEEYLDSKR
jgi:hypothetical protein